MEGSRLSNQKAKGQTHLPLYLCKIQVNASKSKDQNTNWQVRKCVPPLQAQSTKREIHVRRGLRYYLSRSLLTMIYNWYYLVTWWKINTWCLFPEKKTSKQTSNKSLWIGHRHLLERSFCLWSRLSWDIHDKRGCLMLPSFSLGSCIKFISSVTQMYPWLCVNSKDLAFKGFTLKTQLPANSLNGIKLSCEINPQDKNSIWI